MSLIQTLHSKNIKNDIKKNKRHYLPTFIGNKAENLILLLVSCIAIDENLRNVANKLPD